LDWRVGALIHEVDGEREWTPEPEFLHSSLMALTLSTYLACFQAAIDSANCAARTVFLFCTIRLHFRTFICLPNSHNMPAEQVDGLVSFRALAATESCRRLNMSKTTLLSVFVASTALFTGTASAQTTLDNGMIDVTSGTTQYITNVSGGPGTISHIHCTVSQAITGSPFVTFTVVHDGFSNYINTTLYGLHNTWADFFVGAQGSGTGGGASVGDSFDFPVSFPWTSSIQVYGTVSPAGTTGALICLVYR
jgi:hypothetical protein